MVLFCFCLEKQRLKSPLYFWLFGCVELKHGPNFTSMNICQQFSQLSEDNYLYYNTNLFGLVKGNLVIQLHVAVSDNVLNGAR